MRVSTTNPQARAINVKRGPTTGNENPGTKRGDFMAEKAKSGSEKSELATMITDAVAARGRGMKGFRDPTVEGLHTITNTGRGPTRGNAGRQTGKSGAARRGALGATSGY
jgi:hypothetical protein